MQLALQQQALLLERLLVAQKANEDGLAGLRLNCAMEFDGLEERREFREVVERLELWEKQMRHWQEKKDHGAKVLEARWDGNPIDQDKQDRGNYTIIES